MTDTLNKFFVLVQHCFMFIQTAVKAPGIQSKKEEGDKHRWPETVDNSNCELNSKGTEDSVHPVGFLLGEVCLVVVVHG